MEFFQEHSLVALLAVATAVSFAWLCAVRGRLRMPWWAALVVAVAHTLVGVACVKAFAFMESGFDAAAAGNMSLFGGVFFMPVLYAVGARASGRKAADVFDALTPCMLVTLACARFNCVLSGCCAGLPIPGTGLSWPTREAEIAFYAVLLLVLCPRILRGETRGEAYPVYMMSYGVFRFVVEFLRVSDSATGLFHIAHLWAALSLLVGAGAYFEIKSRLAKEKEGKGRGMNGGNERKVRRWTER